MDCTADFVGFRRSSREIREESKRELITAHAPKYKTLEADTDLLGFTLKTNPGYCHEDVD